MEGSLHDGDGPTVSIGEVVTDLMFGLLVQTRGEDAKDGAREAAEGEDEEDAHGQAALLTICRTRSRVMP